MSFYRHRLTLFTLALILSASILSYVKAADCPGTTIDSEDKTFTTETPSIAGTYEFDFTMPNTPDLSPTPVSITHTTFSVYLSPDNPMRIIQAGKMDTPVPSYGDSNVTVKPGLHHIRIEVIKTDSGYSLESYVDTTRVLNTTKLTSIKNNLGMIIQAKVFSGDKYFFPPVIPYSWEISNIKTTKLGVVSNINCFSDFAGYQFPFPDTHYSLECAGGITTMKPGPGYGQYSGSWANWELHFDFSNLAPQPTSSSQSQSVLGGTFQKINNQVLIASASIKQFAKKQPIALTIIILAIIAVPLGTIFYIRKRRRRVE